MKKIFFHILFISLIASCQNNNKVSLSLQNEYLNKNGTLSNNIRLGGYFFENTAKVIPDNSLIPNGLIQYGSIALSTGAPAKLLQRPLFDNIGRVDFSSLTSVNNFPTLNKGDIETDNQIVRMKNGGLLCLHSGDTWYPIPTSYANFPVPGSNGPKNGLRDCIFFFYSPDGGKTWVIYPEIDFGTILNGKYGFPQNNGAGKGGGDREEMYACPFTGNIYVTTRAVSGPFQNEPHKDKTLLFYLNPTTGKWDVIKEDFPGWAPLVMTSTPDGRLFLFHNVGSTPTIYYSINPITPNVKPQISQGYPIYYFDQGKNIPCEGDANNQISLKMSTPSLSRIGADHNCSKIRVAYQAKNSFGRQEARIVRVVVKDPAKGPLVSPIATIRADMPNDYSVLHFNFIDPDYVDIPPGIQSNKSVFYWIESPQNTGVLAPQLSAKYITIEGDFNVSSPAYLSLNNGNPRTWNTPAHPGDYMTGGFFWRNNTLNYLAQWVEPNGIFANIVSAPYQLQPQPQDPPECAAIKKDIKIQKQLLNTFSAIFRSGNKQILGIINQTQRELDRLYAKKKELGCYLE